MSQYDHEFALLIHQIFQKARNLGVKGDEELRERDALERVEKIILSKVGLRDSSVLDRYIENKYGEQIKTIIDYIRDEVGRLKDMKVKLCLNLQHIKMELQEYMEEMQMEYPKGYVPELRKPS